MPTQYSEELDYILIRSINSNAEHKQWLRTRRADKM